MAIIKHNEQDCFLIPVESILQTMEILKEQPYKITAPIVNILNPHCSTNEVLELKKAGKKKAEPNAD